MEEDVDVEATIVGAEGATHNIPNHPTWQYPPHHLQVDSFHPQPSQMLVPSINQLSPTLRSITTIGTCVTVADGMYHSGTPATLANATEQTHRHTCRRDTESVVRQCTKPRCRRIQDQINLDGEGRLFMYLAIMC
jgi:hypothetical protein